MFFGFIIAQTPCASCGMPGGFVQAIELWTTYFSTIFKFFREVCWLLTIGSTWLVKLLIYLSQKNNVMGLFYIFNLLPTYIQVFHLPNRICQQQHPPPMMSVILFLSIDVGVVCPLPLPCPALAAHIHTHTYAPNSLVILKLSGKATPIAAPKM